MNKYRWEKLIGINYVFPFSDNHLRRVIHNSYWRNLEVGDFIREICPATIFPGDFVQSEIMTVRYFVRIHFSEYEHANEVNEVYAIHDYYSWYWY